MQKASYNSEIRTDCPNPGCPNPKTHFYINTATGAAFCHRCHKSYKHFVQPGHVIEVDSLVATTHLLQKQEEDVIITGDRLSYRAKKYLKSRGIIEEVIEFYDIKEGTNGKWVNHLIFTCPNTGYQFGRSYLFKTYRFPAGVSKGKSLFSHKSMWKDVNKDIPARSVCVVVEGAFDVLALEQALYNSVGVALMGSYMTKEQEVALRNFDEIIVWLDPDAKDKQTFIRQRLQRWGNRVREVGMELEPGDATAEDIRRIISCR